jgi:hypothetical protein
MRPREEMQEPGVPHTQIGIVEKVDHRFARHEYLILRLLLCQR